MGGENPAGGQPPPGPAPVAERHPSLKEKISKNFEKALTFPRNLFIIAPVLCESKRQENKIQQIAGLCKGSTTDSDSVCEGSNPSPAASIGASVIPLAPIFCIKTTTRLAGDCLCAGKGRPVGRPFFLFVRRTGGFGFCAGAPGAAMLGKCTGYIRRRNPNEANRRK